MGKLLNLGIKRLNNIMLSNSYLKIRLNQKIDLFVRFQHL